MGEGYDGKIPELMTMYMTASGSYAYRYTAKPTCILYKDVRVLCLLSAWFLVLKRGTCSDTRSCVLS